MVNLDSFVRAISVVWVVIGAQICLASAGLNNFNAPEATEFDLRLAQLIYAKAPSSGTSVNLFDTEAGFAGAASQPKNGGASVLAKKGGSSDGGGNAVGKTLFDFFENDGSIEVTVAELSALEPELQSRIDFLDRQVPAVASFESGGLGQLLTKAISKKRIYLESKSIASNEDCVNQSLVAAANQRVVACQTEREVRISLSYMRQVDTDIAPKAGRNANSDSSIALKKARNRAGLIIHEMFLAFAKASAPEKRKDLLEQSVRYLTRATFGTEQVVSPTISQQLNMDFNLAAYDPVKLSRARATQKFVLENIDQLMGGIPLRYRSLAEANLRSIASGGLNYRRDDCLYILDSFRSALKFAFSREDEVDSIPMFKSADLLCYSDS